MTLLMDPVTTDSPKAGLDATQEAALREALRRCSTATIEAAVRFRSSGEASELKVVVPGILERFLDPDVRAKLASGGEGMRVVEDLGMDSLTLMEAVMLLEEALGVTVKNEELRQIRTVGDIREFVRCKAAGLPLPEPPKELDFAAIAALLPHSPPFLFLQSARLTRARAEGRYTISGQEDFLRGHFRDNPVFPGSIQLEAVGQLAVLHLLALGVEGEARTVDPAKILFASCDGVRCKRVCKPGETLEFVVEPVRARAPFAIFTCTVTVGGEKASVVETLTLAFGWKE
jgi:3-hydroxyacyl-[acyl-carrier-protein] dehydratase